MKKLFAALLSASFMISPMVFSSEANAAPERHVIVEKHVTKKVVVKPRWARGHRMTPAERRRMMAIRDYRRYHLSAPPRGYHWVKVDNDYLLVGITSGIISNFITR
ncbi:MULTISPECIES: RcnB family protein [unclassified Sinorhizobium]|uniref:RcnB family protein n=1 Tax=unclassified Sinorhizobium TaxID=2613772 RepID=UPI003524F139